eukprot:6199746-Pleurochrysis_carterae.AAC.2
MSRFNLNPQRTGPSIRVAHVVHGQARNLRPRPRALVVYYAARAIVCKCKHSVQDAGKLGRTYSRGGSQNTWKILRYH